MSNLAARVLTAAIGIPVVLVVDHFGGIAFAVLVGLAALVSGFELDRLFRAADVPMVPFLPGLAAAAVAVLPTWTRNPEQLWVLGFAAALFVFGMYYLIPGRQSGALGGWTASVGTVLYTGLLLGLLDLLRRANEGAWWIVVVLVLTWAYDTGAYFGGRLFGRHPFMAHISPKKTWEGVIAGLLVSALAGLVATAAIGVLWWQALLIGFGSGVVAQIGDLIESMLKRQAGIKDSGTLIPGHGGLLDRIDSLLFTGVVGYCAAALLGYAT